jgi:hypothetical protein
MSILVEGDSQTIYNMLGDIRALARLILLERRLGGRVQSDDLRISFLTSCVRFDVFDAMRTRILERIHWRP